MDRLILRVCFSSPLPLSHPLLFVEDVLFALCMLRHESLSQHVLHHLLPQRADPAASSERGQVDGLASFLRCFTSGRVVLGPSRTIFSWSQLQKPSDIFAVCASRHHRGLSATVPSFYVKCFGCSAESTSCSEKLGGQQLQHVYLNDLKDDQEWSFSPKKSDGVEHARISHPLKRNNDK